MPSELINSAIVPACVGLVSVAARAGIPRRDLPIVGVAAGVAIECLAAYYTGPNPNYANAAFLGIGLGLSASGLPVASQRVVQYGKTGTAKVRAAATAIKSAVARRPRVSVAVQRPSQAPPVVIPAQTSEPAGSQA